MFVSEIRTFKFRNLADQVVPLKPGVVFVTGLNGNGKTNFIEALYLLSGSRSFRTNSYSELVARAELSCSVFGVVQYADGSEEVGLALSPGSREAFVNRESVGSVSALVGKLLVVAFSPADLSLVKGAPSGRRKFLDRHMVDLQPAYLKLLVGYQRALMSKNAVLKEPYVTYKQLIPWNELLCEYGGKIVDNRRKFLDSLVNKSNPLHASYAPSDGQLALALESDFLQKDELSLDYIREQLEKASGREIAMRSSLVGTQRDDVAITLAGVDCRAYASQGQTRSVVLSLKCGVVELLEEVRGDSPVVLLDDVDSELDAQRSDRLFSMLTEKKRQLIVTGTGEPPLQLKSARDLQVLRVERGVVAEM